MGQRGPPQSPSPLLEASRYSSVEFLSRSRWCAHPISASKSVAPSELPVIGLLFACMLLGMLARWLYFDNRKRKAAQ